MLRVSRLTDYGVLLATQLAGSADPRSVRALSAETGLPRATASKVLKQLTAAGITESVRGARGGYRLARSAEAISLTDTIAALEGPIGFTECDHPDGGACSYEGSCRVRGSWQRIGAVVRDALAGITLAQMAEPASVIPLSAGPRST